MSLEKEQIKSEIDQLSPLEPGIILKPLEIGTILVVQYHNFSIQHGVQVQTSKDGRELRKLPAEKLAIASDLAAARIEIIKAHGIYATLASTFDNVTETSATSANPSMSGYDGYTRTTDVIFVQNDSLDYAVVTVTVTSDLLDAPMTKTVAIAAF